MNRRSFLSSILAAGIAPAFVPFGSLMVPRRLSGATVGVLSEASVEAAMLDMLNATNERGLRINLVPTVLYVSKGFEAAAREVFPAPKLMPFYGEGFNHLKPVEVRIAPLTNGEDWFLAAEGFGGTYRMTKEPVPTIIGDLRKMPVRIDEM